MLFEYKVKPGIQRRWCHWKGHFYTRATSEEILLLFLSEAPRTCFTEWAHTLQKPFSVKRNENRAKCSAKGVPMDTSWGPPCTRQLQLWAAATQLHLHPGAIHTDYFCLGFTVRSMGTRNTRSVLRKMGDKKRIAFPPFLSCMKIMAGSADSYPPTSAGLQQILVAVLSSGKTLDV